LQFQNALTIFVLLVTTATADFTAQADKIRVKVMKCPICREETSWQNNIYRPFCSERCKMLDLGRWADGEYRIGGGPRTEVEAETSDSDDHVDSEQLN
jgi:uncharacterized protein